jgi:hypothetical protein
VKDNFINPYKGVTDSSRVTFSVASSDKLLLKLVRPRMGTETTVCSLLYKKFCDALREKGMTDFTSSKKLEEFAVNLSLVYGPKPKSKS